MADRPTIDPSLAFVLGTGRCGSTLVQEIVARHPSVGFLSNLDDRFPVPASLGRWNGPIYRSTPEWFARKGRIRFAPSEGYRALARKVSPVLVAPARDLVEADATPWIAGALRSFFDARAAAQGAPMFLHKFTGWPRAGLLHAVFPEARYVHVVRDGRAVANSFLQMPWWRGFEGPEAWGWGPIPDAYRAAWDRSGGSYPVLAGIQWMMLIDAFDAARQRIAADRWLELRYEDIVADPRGRLQEVLTFLGLAWDDGFEQGFRRYTFRTERTHAYRDDLGAADVEALDALLATHLERLGYGSS
jgi:hypothetical protein